VCAVWGGRKRGKKACCFRLQPAAAAASVGRGQSGRGIGRSCRSGNPFLNVATRRPWKFQGKIIKEENMIKNAPFYFVESRQQVNKSV
jgi:hypothetical protein